MSGNWSTGLCSCFSDCKSCLLTYFCPCYVQGKNAEGVGEDCVKCALVMFCPIANLYFRAKVRGQIREKQGISGTMMNDCLMAWCCPLCSLSQEARELGTFSPAGDMERS